MFRLQRAEMSLTSSGYDATRFGESEGNIRVTGMT